MIGHPTDQCKASGESHKPVESSSGREPLSGIDQSLVPGDVVERAMGVDAAVGLSDEEAERRLHRYGANRLAGAPQVPQWRKFIEQFRDPLVYLLLAATAISVVAWVIERANARPGAGGSEPVPYDALVIVLILVVNAILGYVQEAKAEQAVQALARMTAPQACVMRNGRMVRIETSDVVPGDVLVLAEGDSVCADGRLILSASLRVAEASLTGESVPVGKNPAFLSQAKALGDRTNMVFSGTSVTQGTGRAIVTATGMRTQVGKIADMLARGEDEATPLQKEMAHVSKILGIAVCLIALVVLAALALMEGFHDIHDVIDSLLLAVSFAVAAVPEGLAAILTVVLALGVQRMAQHHAIVKKLSSVETLGSASVICSDKTGTLTRNEMTVERVVTPSGEVRLTGTGYSPQGRMVCAHGSGEGEDVDRVARVEVLRTLGIGALANDGQLHKNEGSGTWEAVGDPTEVSLVVAAEKIKADRKYASFTRVAEIPFTSERKRMSVVARDEADAGRLTVFSKGAPDVLLDQCSRIAVGSAVRVLTDGDRQDILAQVGRLSSEAYRTLGEAYRPLETDSLAGIEGIESNVAGEVGDIAEQDGAVERDLVWAGMVAIIDPPRTEVRNSVRQARRAGIRTVMITGDHPLTARRIASDLGMIDPSERTLTGEQLDALDDADAMDRATSEVSVYARVAPEHKLRIVESLQRQGNIVAMTGDGVNDAPAVKAADIGVAMGVTGTEVTKESAAMILADDDFSTIVAAVREGRGIFDNIRKFLRYLLSSNVGEVFTVFGGVVFAGFLGITQPGSSGVTVPLLATQLLWINLLTDAAPALAMGVDPSRDDVMGRKPRRLTDRVIDRQMWGDIVYIGIIMAAVTLVGMDMHLDGGLFTDHSIGTGHEMQMVEARTMGFTILVFAQMFNALASRSHLSSAVRDLFSNGWLWAAIGMSVILQIAVVYVPFLNEAFGTVPLHGGAWLECVGLAFLVLLASELRKAVLRAVISKRGRTRRATSPAYSLD